MASEICSTCGASFVGPRAVCPVCAADVTVTVAGKPHVLRISLMWFFLVCGIVAALAGLIAQGGYEGRERAVTLTLVGVVIGALGLVMALLLLCSKALTDRIHGWSALALGIGGSAIVYLAAYVV